MKTKVIILLTMFFTSCLAAAPAPSEVNAVLTKYANNPKGWSALNYAIEQRDVAAAIILLDYVRDFNKEDAGLNALYRLLFKSGIDYDPKFDEEALPLIDALLEKGVNIKYEYDSDKAPLFWSMRNPDLVIKLLKKGANPNERKGVTFSQVVQRGDLKLIEAFLDHGAKMNGEIWTQHVSHSCDDILLEFLLSKVGCDAVSLQVLLRGAVERSNYNRVKLLLERFRNLKKNYENLQFCYDSLLEYAAQHSQYDMAKLLIEYGAAVNPIKYANNHPLLLAIHSKDVKMVSLLLKNGADPNSLILKNGNKSILAIALYQSDAAGGEIVDLLLQYAAKL